MAFAESIKSTATSVSRYVTGERIPEPEIMQRIFDATGGLVTANDFYGLPSNIPTPAVQGRIRDKNATRAGAGNVTDKAAARQTPV